MLEHISRFPLADSSLSFSERVEVVVTGTDVSSITVRRLTSATTTVDSDITTAKA
jgi:hypothetical protein